jgi:hypothetical protein
VKVGIVTREYPPEVYGGAGVHVEYLSGALAHLVDVAVHCFGRPRASPLVAGSYEPWHALDGGGPHVAALRHMSTDLAIVPGLEGVDLVHTHQVTEPDVAQHNRDTLQDLFLAGKLAMIATGPWFAGMIPERAKDLKWAVAPMPRNQDSM